jgi:hypothetical protein
VQAVQREEGYAEETQEIQVYADGKTWHLAALIGRLAQG